MNNSKGRYYAKNTESGTFADLTTLFNGLAILKVDGFLKKGEPVNIYTAQWVDSQEEDMLITTLDENNVPIVIRKNVDLEITFIVRQKYASGGAVIDVQTVHDAFIDYMTNTDVWIKSAYMGNKYAHCICLKEYKPTTVMLGRGDNSYILGTLPLHTLDAPTTEQE